MDDIVDNNAMTVLAKNTVMVFVWKLVKSSAKTETMILRHHSMNVCLENQDNIVPFAGVCRVQPDRPHKAREM